MLRPTPKCGSRSRWTAGIDDDVIRGVRQQVVLGTSVLFVMTGNVVLDEVAHEFADSGASLLSTHPTSDREARLREALADAG